MSPIRVLIADDHPTFVRALRLMLDTDDGIDVVAAATDGEEAVELTLVHQPDVVLMDVHMPRASGVDAARRLAEAAPHVAVVVLTMFDDDDVVAEALRAGALGFVLKGARPEDIRRAIVAAHEGDVIVGRATARRIPGIVGPPPGPAPAPDPRAAFPELTDREYEVLRELAAGRDNLRIAQALYLSEKTVRNYVSMLLVKLGAGSRTEAAVLARDRGIVPR